MGFVEMLAAKWKRYRVRSAIRALAKMEDRISAAESEKKAMEERNPLIGRVGMMMGIGSPPPGFEGAIQAGESKFNNLVQRLSDGRQKEGALKAKLSALTGKNFAKASEWEQWFRTSHQ